MSRPRRGLRFIDEALIRGAASEGANDVKYILLIYQAPGAFDALPQEQRDALMGEFNAFSEQITKSGEFVGGAALADPASGRVVRVRDGRPATTDGPFAEAKEQLAGYYVVDCESLERATEIAATDPASRLWAIEVRPVMDEAGMEM
jgi:hypothetical protein